MLFRSYARTGKNLASTPGLDRFQVPTTAQFFAHSRSTYIRNYVRRGPTLERAAILSVVLTHDELATRFLRAARASARLGGYFHLWGHSWELDEYDLWEELDRLLGQLRQLDARFVTNAAWCATLSMTAEKQPPVAVERSADLTETRLARSDFVESS